MNTNYRSIIVVVWRALLQVSWISDGEALTVLFGVTPESRGNYNATRFLG